MAFKIVLFFAAVAYTNAGLIAAPVGIATYASPVLSYNNNQAYQTAITSQHQNILRSSGNLAQVSTYSKTIDTPYSSVSKHDVRVSNPGYLHTTYAAAPVATYAAPALHASYATPAVHTSYAAPALHTTYAAPALVKSYSPALATYSAPAVQAHYAAPAVHNAYAATAVHGPVNGLLGVAYSAAPAVAHVEYHGNYGLNYAF